MDGEPIFVRRITFCAPLVGLIGTLAGMLGSFQKLATAEQLSYEMLVSGIGTALLWTATGLLLSVAVVISASLFRL
jgi:biopolymer transport protein ExbB